MDGWTDRRTDKDFIGHCPNNLVSFKQKCNTGMTFQRNPICGTYRLEKLHEQFSSFQSLMFNLKMLIFSEPFVFWETRSHIIGSKYSILSDPL